MPCDRWEGVEGCSRGRGWERIVLFFNVFFKLIPTVYFLKEFCRCFCFGFCVFVDAFIHWVDLLKPFFVNETSQLTFFFWGGGFTALALGRVGDFLKDFLDQTKSTFGYRCTLSPWV